MDEQDKYSKTEAPTPRRREKAREQGDIAYSAELTAGLAMLATVLAFWWSGAAAGEQLQEAVRRQLGHLPFSTVDAVSIRILLVWTLRQLMAIVGVVVGVTFAVSLAVGGWQAGFRVTGQPLRPSLERLHPAKGWSRIWSTQSLMRGSIATGKTLAIGFIIVWVVYRQSDLFVASSRGTVRGAVGQCWSVVEYVGLAVALSLVSFGMLDFLFQRWRHDQQLRMSRQELKDERKDEEGDPHVRAKIKKMQREAAKHQMLRDVPRATVVLTNPTHLAIALKYERGMAAPVVVAKGAGHVARRIVQLARKNDVPVLERKPLARLLFQTTEVGQEIPPNVYRAIAEIVAYLYQLGRVA